MKKEIFERIKNLSWKDKQTTTDFLAHLTEEVGEVATAIRVIRGLKDKKLSESVESECCDVIVMAVAILSRHLEWDSAKVNETILKKCERWESRL